MKNINKLLLIFLLISSNINAEELTTEEINKNEIYKMFEFKLPEENLFFSAFKNNIWIPLIDFFDKSKEPLNGIDENNNSIRDDIEIYINNLLDNDTQKKSLFKLSNSIVNSINIDIENEKILFNAKNNILKSIYCVHSNYNINLSNEKIKEIENLVINNKERRKNYKKFNNTFSIYYFDKFENNNCN